MKLRIFCNWTVITALLLIVGCTQIPQQTINEAKSALDAAKKADAQKFAPSQMQAALVSYELAKKELVEESRKLSFMRKYSKIIETLKSATNAAESALSAAETVRNTMTSETQGLLARAQAIVDSVDTIVSAATAKKKNTGTLPAGLDSVNAKIRDAGAVLGSGDLFLAKEMALSAQYGAEALVFVADTLFPAKRAKKK